MSDLLQAILPKLNRGDCPVSDWPNARGEWKPLCPFHDDHHSGSFQVSERGYKCWACDAKGSLEDLAAKLGVLQCCSVARGDTSTNICTLQMYSDGKHLPVDFLKGLGLRDRSYRGETWVDMPYYDEAGRVLTSRQRVAMTGKLRVKSPYKSHLHLYGLWKLQEARDAGYVIVVKGESDAQTLWLYGLPAVGVPGASCFKAEWASYFDGLAVYVWREPDVGGPILEKGVGEALPDARIMIPPDGRKDVNECHVLGDDVPALLGVLKGTARPYRERKKEDTDKAAAHAGAWAAQLIGSDDILSEFAKLCEALGLRGEEQTAKLLYLAFTSRLLEKPISVVVKGPSSGGKSFTVETVLKAFPDSAYYALSSMSERSLAYSQEPLEHRFLVLYEAAGLTSDFGTYLMRTLLSEGRIRYETVEKTQDGLVPKLIEREGPTGLVVTTTWSSLHPENETRMLSLTVRDDPAQTRAVFCALAERANGHKPPEANLTPWLALQTWLELAGCRDVSIPYAHELAEHCSAKAVRLRRDFGALLNLVRTHAILHQRRRERDGQGRIVATVADYRAVYDLVLPLISEGVQATVSKTVRETVKAVAELNAASLAPVSLTELATALDLDKSATSRRVRVALDLGYLTNLEDKKGKPARLLPGDALPQDAPVLPDPDTIKCMSCIPPCNTATLQHSDGPEPQAAPTAAPTDAPDSEALADARAGVGPLVGMLASGPMAWATFAELAINNHARPDLVETAALECGATIYEHDGQRWIALAEVTV